MKKKQTWLEGQMKDKLEAKDYNESIAGFRDYTVMGSSLIGSPLNTNPIEEKKSEYGNPVDMFRKVSVLASLITEKDLTPQDCVKVMIAVKLSREAFKHKEDNLVDLKGYTEILEMINDNEN